MAILPLEMIIVMAVTWLSNNENVGQTAARQIQSGVSVALQRLCSRYLVSDGMPSQRVEAPGNNAKPKLKSKPFGNCHRIKHKTYLTR